MSTFEVKVQPIFTKPHSNADKLELGNIGSPEGWQVVIAKDRFVSGDMCAYIGENAVVPEDILKYYGYWNTEKDKGLLAGSKGDRVKAVRLRDEFSLGIVLPVIECKEGWYKFPHTSEDQLTGYFKLDDDVSEILGVTKYEPPIPVCMAGEVYNAGTHIGVNYDIENIKKFTSIFVEGEEVQVTEKIHGTFCQIALLPGTQNNYHEDHFVIPRTISGLGVAAYIAISSKGLGGQGLFLKNNEKNSTNIYVRTAKTLFERLTRYDVQEPITVCGEVFGHNVQDLHYGCKVGETSFRVFDVYVGRRGQGRWLTDVELDEFCTKHELQRVPVVYKGPFSLSKINELAQNAFSTFDANQILEGVVIKPLIERHDSVLGRVVLKSINEKYLTRKGGTEYN